MRHDFFRALNFSPPTARHLLRFVFAALTMASAPLAVAKSYRLAVAAASVDRAAMIASFSLPVDAPKPAALFDAAGHELPLQVDRDGVARFIIAAQKADETLTFTLGEGGAPKAGEANVIVAPDRGDLRISIGDAPVLVYRMDKDALPRGDIDAKFKRAGYLHPVFSPSGKIVTGDYPSNHVHHHAIWSAWSRTGFEGRKPNFWEMGEQTGTVEFVALDRTWSGPVHGGFVARQRMVDLSAPAPVTAIAETWELTAYNVPIAATPVRMFDLVITQACATRDPILLPKYHYGGLGFRGPEAWDGKTKLAVLSSEGETSRGQANATRVRWCYLGGKEDGGAVAGVAILGHPENFRAPQPIRVHPSMPFFCFAPTALDDFSIVAGKPYVARYRFVVIDNKPDYALIEACWNGYAIPAQVRIMPIARGL